MKERSIILFSVLIIAIIFLLTLLEKQDAPLQMIDRASGIYALFFIFLAIVSSEYMKQMKKIFGKGFMSIHHFSARIGVLLMLIHPIAFALEERNINVFLPVFYPLKDFLELAGRPAFYLILIAVMAAVYRKKIIRKWKKIHYLNYPAFLMVFVHSWLIGTDLRSEIMQVIWIAMLLVVIGVFVHKHVVLSEGLVFKW